MKIIIIDLQAFKLRSGRVIIKELCFFDGSSIYNYLFQPSTSFENLNHKDRKTVEFLTHKHHCLDYSGGFIEYTNLPKILEFFLHGVDRVYVKGAEKRNILLDHTIHLKMCPLVINLEFISTCFPPPPLLKKTEPCKFHNNTRSAVCAANNCRILYNYIMSLLPL